MSSGDSVEIVYRELRDLCLADPLAAKRRIVALLDAHDPVLDGILARAVEPSDGRLRQTIARSLQKRPEIASFARTLQEWRSRETDEFALSAIDDALAVETEPAPRERRSEELPELAATFRYLSGRIRHRVLNALPRAGLGIEKVRLSLLRGSTPPPEATLQLLDDLRDALRAVESAVDFGDEAASLEVRTINLVEWIPAFTVRHPTRFPTVSIRTEVDGVAATACVRAAVFHLETIFANLFDNCRQAVGDSCQIEVVILAERDSWLVRVLDSGGGLKKDDVERAFHLPYSSTSRPGRGHMEVGEAMTRLGGTAAVQRMPEGSYRVVLSFPRVPP